MIQTVTLAENHWSTPIGKRAPNFLTMLRLFVIPIFVVLMIDPDPNSRMWAAGIFIGASLTDWFDGYLARLYSAETRFGKLMDPLADKILVMAALVMLAANLDMPRLPAWVVVVLLSREMIINGVRSICAVEGIVVSASHWAKHKTFWMMVAISGCLIRETYEILPGIHFDFFSGGMFFIWVSLVLSVGTGINYVVDLQHILRAQAGSEI